MMSAAVAHVAPEGGERFKLVDKYFHGLSSCPLALSGCDLPRVDLLQVLSAGQRRRVGSGGVEALGTENGRYVDRERRKEQQRSHEECGDGQNLAKLGPLRKQVFHDGDGSIRNSAEEDSLPSPGTNGKNSGIWWSI